MSEKDKSKVPLEDYKKVNPKEAKLLAESEVESLRKNFDEIQENRAASLRYMETVRNLLNVNRSLSIALPDLTLQEVCNIFVDLGSLMLNMPCLDGKTAPYKEVSLGQSEPVEIEHCSYQMLSANVTMRTEKLVGQIGADVFESIGMWCLHIARTLMELPGKTLEEQRKLCELDDLDSVLLAAEAPDALVQRFLDLERDIRNTESENDLIRHQNFVIGRMLSTSELRRDKQVQLNHKVQSELKNLKTKEKQLQDRIRQLKPQAAAKGHPRNKKRGKSI